MLNPYEIGQLEFQLRDEIGLEGKNSQVFTAHDPQLNAELVIKKVRKDSINDESEFFLEASHLYRSSHTNVVPIHYACHDDDHIYLAMPYFPNGSLKTLMGKRMLTVREIIVISTQFLSGLHHIHSKGLVHFDIKPDNILMSPRGEAVLSDFGLAKQTKYNGHAEQDRVYGKMTPPEAFNTNQFSIRFDIFQAGLTFYRMCVGDDVFYKQYEQFIENETLNRDLFRHSIVSGQFPERSSFPEHIPERLKKMIKKCLDVNPADRYSSVIDVVNELAQIDGEVLDWKYELKETEKVWTKDEGDKVYQLTVNNDGSSTATSKIGDGGSRRITNYCKSGITTTEIRRFFKRY